MNEASIPANFKSIAVRYRSSRALPEEKKSKNCLANIFSLVQWKRDKSVSVIEDEVICPPGEEGDTRIIPYKDGKMYVGTIKKKSCEFNLFNLSFFKLYLTFRIYFTVSFFISNFR